MSYHNVKIPKELVNEIDEFIKNSSFRNRTEFIIYQIRKTLDKNRPLSSISNISNEIHGTNG